MSTPGTRPACGLHRLTAEEAPILFLSIGALAGRDFLAAAAFARLEEDGWRPGRIVGYESVNGGPGPEESLVILRAGSVQRFDPPAGADRLEPGAYWLRGDGRVWQVLLPDASTAQIWRADD